MPWRSVKQMRVKVSSHDKPCQASNSASFTTKVSIVAMMVLEPVMTPRKIAFSMAQHGTAQYRSKKHKSAIEKHHVICRCHCVTVSPCSVFFVFWLLTADPRHSLPAATPPLNEASLHKDLKLPALYAGEKWVKREMMRLLGKLCNFPNSPNLEPGASLAIELQCLQNPGGCCS